MCSELSSDPGSMTQRLSCINYRDVVPRHLHLSNIQIAVTLRNEDGVILRKENGVKIL